MIRESATPEQKLQLEKELDSLDAKCHLLIDLIQKMYGSDDATAIRAQELCNDLQRLRWTLQRKNVGEMASGGHPSR